MTQIMQDRWTAVASDAYRMDCRRWRPESGDIKGRALVLHGIQSHSGWYEKLGFTLAVAGIDVVMPDRRGSGANVAERGHARSSRQLFDDLDVVLDNWKARTEGTWRPPILAGISWGGKMAVLKAARNPDSFSGLALIAPGLFAKVRPPWVTQLAIAFCAFAMPRRQFAIPLSDPALFTSSLERQNFIATDAATLHTATARFFVVSRFMDIMLKRVADRVRCPVLLQLAGQDRIVENQRIRSYVGSFPSDSVRVIDYPNAHHTLEFEPEPIADLYARDFAAWIISQEPNESTG